MKTKSLVVLALVPFVGCVNLTETGLFGEWSSRDDASLQVQFVAEFSGAEAEQFFLADKNANVYALKQDGVAFEAGQFEVQEAISSLVLFVSFRDGAAITDEQCTYSLAQGDKAGDLQIGELEAGSSPNCFAALGGADYDRAKE